MRKGLKKTLALMLAFVLLCSNAADFGMTVLAEEATTESVEGEVLEEVVEAASEETEESQSLETEESESEETLEESEETPEEDEESLEESEETLEESEETPEEGEETPEEGEETSEEDEETPEEGEETPEEGEEIPEEGEETPDTVCIETCIEGCTGEACECACHMPKEEETVVLETVTFKSMKTARMTARSSNDIYSTNPYFEESIDSSHSKVSGKSGNIPLEYTQVIIGAEEASEVIVKRPEISELEKWESFNDGDKAAWEGLGISWGWKEGILTENGTEYNSSVCATYTTPEAAETNPAAWDNYYAITDPNKYYVIYRNIGTVNGSPVHLKVSVADYDILDHDDNINDSQEGLTPVISLGLKLTPPETRIKVPAVTTLNISWIQLRYQFLDNSGNPIGVKGMTTYYDIDARQAVALNDSTCDGIYVKNCELKEATISNWGRLDGKVIYCSEEHNVDYTAGQSFSHGFTEIFDTSKSLDKTMLRTFSFKTQNVNGITANGGIYHYGDPVQQGNLTVTKNVVNAPAGTAPTFDFTVRLNYGLTGTYGGMRFVNGVANFKLGNGGSKTATGLPAGIGYTVTETPVAGYVTSKTGDSGVIVDGNTAVAAFTNTYQASKKLTVHKTVDVGDTSKYFVFTLDADGTAYDQTFTLKSGESKTIELPEGTNYTVTESVDANYNTKVNGAAGNSAKGRLNADTDVRFVNTAKDITLTIAKNVSGADKSKSFTFQVTLKNLSNANIAYKAVSDASKIKAVSGGYQVTLKHGESIVLTVPYGTKYTVSEDDAPGYTETVSGAENGTLTTAGATVTYTNIVDKKLEIKKAVTDNQSVADANQEFEFTLKTNAAADKVSYTNAGKVTAKGNGTYKIMLKAGDAVIFTLPHGSTYSVEEADYDEYGYSIDLPAVGKYEGTLTEDHTGSNGLQFINAANAQTLTLKKVVDGSANEKNAKYDFEIQINYAVTDKAYERLIQAGVTPLGNGKYKVSLADDEEISLILPAKCTYSVRETSTGNYVTTVDGSIASTTGEKTLPDNGATHVFTNTTKRTLTVSKTISGVFADSNKEFEFKLTATKAGSPVQYLDCTKNGEVEVSYADNTYTIKLKGNESVTFTFLYGTAYKVVETADDNYVTTVRGIETYVAEGILNTLETQLDTSAPYKNTSKVTKLVVEKNVTGDTKDSDKPFEFTVELKDRAGNAYSALDVSGISGVTNNGDGTYTFELTERQNTKTLYPLPYGIEYEVVEDDYTAHGYETTVPANAAEQMTGAGREKVAEGILTQTNEVSYTNNALEQYLTINKVVDGNAEDLKDSFTFNLYVEYSYDSKPYTKNLADLDGNGSISITNNGSGNYTFTLKNGESVKVKLPKNCKYVVTEAGVTDESGNAVVLTDKYITTIGGDYKDAVLINKMEYNALDSYTGVQDAAMAEDATITFTNIAKKTLKVSKEIAGVFADPDKEFEFQLTLTKDGVAQQYLVCDHVENVTAYDAANGIYTIELKGNEEVTFTLPHGTDYILTESSYDEYVTEITVDGVEADKAEAKLISDTEIEFTNTAKVTELTVEKEVTGITGSEKKEFKFTVTLTKDGGFKACELDDFADADEATAEKIVYTFKLKHDQIKKLYPLPYGVSYEIVEDDYTAHGYDAVNAITGKLTDDGNLTVVNEGVLSDTSEETMTNVALDRKLKVGKDVLGDNDAKQKKYNFTLQVIYADGEPYHKPIPGTQSVLGSGIYTFSLSHDEEIEFTLPLYCNYVLKEQNYSKEGYTTYHSHQIKNASGEYEYVFEGELGRTISDKLEEDQKADYLNQEPVNLRITKKVEGNGGDKLFGKFEFTLKLERFGKAVEYVAHHFEGAEVTEIEKGLYKIVMGHQDSAFFRVPYGTKYEVVEKDYSYKEYETTVNGVEGREAKGKVKDVENETVIKFVNTREVTPEIYLAPKTGDEANIALYAGLGIVAFAGLAAVIFFKKKKTE